MIVGHVRNRNRLKVMKIVGRLVCWMILATSFTSQAEAKAFQASMDFGDAPDSYSTLIASGGPSHTVLADFHLGASVDSEADGQPTAGADGDDTSGTDDEDGVVFNSGLGLPATFNVIQAGVSNDLEVSVNLPTGTSQAFLSGWIDLNQDGDFADAGEQIFDDQTVGNGQNNLSFTVPNTIVHGDSFARFRLASQANDADTPGGSANDGEVEDYPVQITVSALEACNFSLENGGFEEPIVTGPTPFIQSFGGSIKTYLETVVPGISFIADPPSGNATLDNAIEIWRTGLTFEGSQYAEINAYLFGYLYQDKVTIPGTVLDWSFAHRGRLGVDTISLNVGAPGAEVSQGTFSTGNTAWSVYSGSYTVPAGQFITRFAYEAIASAGGNTGAGNFVDAAEFDVQCDYGDAPASYAVLSAQNGASHSVNPAVALGAAVSDESDGQPSANADADSDDDGIVFLTALVGGQPAEIQVTATGSGFLSAWFDLNQDGDWNDPNEFVLNAIPINPGTQNVAFQMPSITAGGTSFARFRFATNPVTSPDSPSLFPGEVEDYVIQLIMPIIPPNLPSSLPETGFAPGVVTGLAPPPFESGYYASNLRLSIPQIAIELDIVGVPLVDDEWNLGWLESGQAGYLHGTAFPTLPGNSVLTAHVWNADNTPGPFYGLDSLVYSDRFRIEAWGQSYVYEVRSNDRYSPWSMTPLQSKDYDWVTLITCEGFDARSGTYLYRRVVLAVLVAVE